MRSVRPSYLPGAIVPAAPAGAQTCAADCTGDGAVAINEIILGVRIAGGDAPIGDCLAMDGDGNGAVTVNEVVAARDCSGDTSRCSLPDTFVTCGDGVLLRRCALGACAARSAGKTRSPGWEG